MTKPYRLFLPLLFLLLAGCSSPDPKLTGGAQVLSQKKFRQWMNANSEYLLLDVRSGAEYQSGHIPGAQSLPHMEIIRLIPQLRDWHDGKIILYDETGRRAAMTAKALLTSGFLYVYVLDGHLPEWIKNSGRLE